MKCVHCGAIIDDGVEINEWDACPICRKRMLGFRDDALDFAVECLLNDVRGIEKKLHMLRERLRQNRDDHR